MNYDGKRMTEQTVLTFMTKTLSFYDRIEGV